MIADQCAVFVNLVFNNPQAYSGSTLALSAVLFSFQIYCDFSGYSDIAIGTARLFGIDLLRNFAFPYFSRDIAEFWRRWHISLSSWFRDYLYIPLGGNNGGNLIKIRNVLIIFLVSGFWHGANWTFIIWGLLNAIYILPLILFKRNRNHLDIVASGKLLPTAKELLSILLTFFLTVLAWIFFRSESVEQAFIYISRICSTSVLSSPEMPGKLLFLSLFFFWVIEWAGREQQYALENFALTWPKPVRWSAYIIVGLSTFYFSGSDLQFIYFQF